MLLTCHSALIIEELFVISSHLFHLVLCKFIHSFKLLKWQRQKSFLLFVFIYPYIHYPPVALSHSFTTNKREIKLLILSYTFLWTVHSISVTNTGLCKQPYWTTTVTHILIEAASGRGEGVVGLGICVWYLEGQKTDYQSRHLEKEMSEGVPDSPDSPHTAPWTVGTSGISGAEHFL